VKIVVISGSPKGENSISLQYFNYARKHFPANEYSVYHVGRDIKKIQADASLFRGIIDEVKAADGIVWTFPVYHFSVPSQLKTFIEMAFEKAPEAFRGKYATALTTSVHFYDHTAHNYVNAVSCDLDMKYVDGFSAEMNDLMDQSKRDMLLKFFRMFFDSIENRRPTEVRFPPVPRQVPKYVPGPVIPGQRAGGKKIVVVTDATAVDVNLQGMIEAFVNSAGDVDVVNLHDVKINGGCLGCIKCGYDNSCVYKDGFRAAYDRIMSAEAIVYAGSIKDRSLSARWKLFFDRSFFTGHSPSEDLKQIGYIISGPLSGFPDLRQELEARVNIGNGNLAGFVTDESGDPVHITAMLRELADRIHWSAAENFRRPPNFLGLGGHLVFRDLVYNMSGVFGADYRFYRKHGLLDYPQKDYKNRLLNFGLRNLMRIPQARKEFFSRAVTEMASAHKKISGE